MSDERDPAEVGWDLNQPIDMTSVHVDDDFIEALSQDHPVPTRDDAEYQLAELMSGWRHEVLETPMPDLPTVDEVEAAIAATERVQRGRGVVRHLRVASGVAAIVVIAGAGLTVLAEGSSPGDPLWGVKRVVFSEAASQTQAAMDVQSNLEKAEAAMAGGDTAQAAELIAKAQKDLDPVRDSATRDRMNEWIKRLEADASSAKSSSAASSSASSKAPAAGSSTDQSTGPSTPPRDLRRETGGGSVTVTVPTSQNPNPTQGTPNPPDDTTGQTGTDNTGTSQPQEPAPPTVTTTTPTPTSSPADLPVPSGGQGAPDLSTTTTPAPAGWFW